jgi:hypothetical protein
MKRRALQELISCCRPDLSDLTEDEARALSEALEQDAQLREQFQAQQAWDVAIGRAMHDVPVPDSLADRLQASLATAAPADPVTVRRSFVSALLSPLPASLLAAAALVLFALWFIVPRGDNLTADQVAAESRTWIGQLDAEAWQPTDALVLEQFPLDPSVRLRVVSCQQCSAISYGQAMVYRADLPPDQRSAYLFVIRTAQGRSLPTIPRSVPDSTTGGICIGVWKSKGCLYVLVVPGTQSDYQKAVPQDVA